MAREMDEMMIRMTMNVSKDGCSTSHRAPLRKPFSGPRQKSETPSRGTGSGATSTTTGSGSGSGSAPSPSGASSSSSSSSANASSRMATKRFMMMKKPMMRPGMKNALVRSTPLIAAHTWKASTQPPVKMPKTVSIAVKK